MWCEGGATIDEPRSVVLSRRPVRTVNGEKALFRGFRADPGGRKEGSCSDEEEAPAAGIASPLPRGAENILFMLFLAISP